MATYNYPLSHARTFPGAPVFNRLPNGLGIIVAVHGPEPNNLAIARAKGESEETVPLLIDVEWLNGLRETTLSCLVGDYDLYLEYEEAMHRARLERRARLPIAGLPVHRP